MLFPYGTVPKSRDSAIPINTTDNRVLQLRSIVVECFWKDFFKETCSRWLLCHSAHTCMLIPMQPTAHSIAIVATVNFDTLSYHRQMKPKTVSA